MMAMEARAVALLRCYWDLTVIIHDKVECKVLNEELCVVPHCLTVERVQDCVPRPVRRTRAPIGLTTLAKVERLAACKRRRGWADVEQKCLWGGKGEAIVRAMARVRARARQRLAGRSCPRPCARRARHSARAR